MKLAELTGKAIFFDQGGGQGDIISLTAFFTKENHGERTLLIFLSKKCCVIFHTVVTYLDDKRSQPPGVGIISLFRFSITIQNAIEHVG